MKKFDGQEMQRVQFVEVVKDVKTNDAVSELKTIVDIPYTEMPVGTYVNKVIKNILSFGAKRYGFTFRNTTDIVIKTSFHLFDSSVSTGLGGGHQPFGAEVGVATAGVVFFKTTSGAVADAVFMRFPVGDIAPTKGSFTVYVREVL